MHPSRILPWSTGPCAVPRHWAGAGATCKAPCPVEEEEEGWLWGLVGLGDI